MADAKDSDQSFFRKVVRFVSNPTTDWADLASRPADNREQSAELSELKAMVERKRRNDFVRKREFDMLRKVRRDGLTSEQLAALGGNSRLDESDLRNSDLSPQRQDSAVKAKIDDIEREMVGGADTRSGRPSMPFASNSMLQRPPSGFAAGPNARPAVLPPLPPALAAGLAAERSGLGPAAVEGRPPAAFDPAATQPSALLPPLPPPTGPGVPPLSGTPSSAITAPPAPLPALSAQEPAAMGTPVADGPGSGAAPSDFLSFNEPPASPPVGASGLATLDIDVDVQVNEIVHDPELDEAVMAFANADYAQSETALLQLTTPTGPRARHAETWLVLFDLYRAIGQQQRFETLANDYALQFGSSAPQWMSLPKLVADALAEDRPRAARQAGDAGWFCPAVLEPAVVAQLRTAVSQMPLPWVMDWSDLKRVEPEGARSLLALFRSWAGQRVDMQWLGGDQLISVLAQAGPTGEGSADPAFWLARLEALRLANRADHFDEVAIDYCVTYEVSPPAWEPARCSLKLFDSELTTRGPSLSRMSGLSTSFVESSLVDDPGPVQVGTVELSGQLIGDQSASLRDLDAELASATVVNVSCARLIRVDFVAAGDLLNWVINKHRQGRVVQFIDAHRLVALFFGAMGITEHAKVRVRTV